MIEECTGVSRVVAVLRDVGFVGPMIWGKNAGSDDGFAVQKVADERGAIGGVGKGLANFAMGEDGVLKVDAEVGEIRAAMFGDSEIGLTAECGNHVGGKRTHLKVGGTFAKFEGADDGVGDDAEANGFNGWRANEIAGIFPDDDLIVLRLRDEAKWTGADRMKRKIGRGVLRNDADRGTREVPEERGVGFFQVKDDGGGIGRFDFRDVLKGATLWRVIRGIEHEIERGFDVGRSEGAPVMKMNVSTEMEDVDERIWSVPRLGQVAVKVHVVVVVDEAAEEQAVNALGLRIGGEARIEIYGIGFDEESDGVGIEFLMVAATDEKKERTTQNAKETAISKMKKISGAGHSRFFQGLRIREPR